LVERDLFAKTGSRLFRIILCQYLSLRVTIDATKWCRSSSIRRQRRELWISPIGRSPADRGFDLFERVDDEG
jgi:hypothetical protein